MEEIEVTISEITMYGRARHVRCIPEKFYTLKNLRAASLDGIALGAVKDSVLLPSVKILHLLGVEIADLESLERLISRCPVLETLHLGRCRTSYRYGKEQIQVSLPSLKNLRIRRYAMGSIVIEAPKLEDLYLEQFTELLFKGSSSPLPCLHSAHVDAGEKCRASYRDLFEILVRISNAKKIHLCGNLSHLPFANDFRLVFPNLTHLTIGAGHTAWVLRSFLKSASKLQSLVMDMVNDLRQPIKWKSLGTACTPGCLLSSLQEIEIKEFVTDEEGRKMIAYLLKAGAVLKKVNLHINECYFEMNGRNDLVSLLKFSRRSSACEVRIFFFPNVEFIYRDSDGETNTDDDSDDDSDDETDNEYDTSDDEEDSL